jgi:hypothetical protein
MAPAGGFYVSIILEMWNEIKACAKSIACPAVARHTFLPKPEQE